MELRAKFGEINALLRLSCSLAQPCGQMLWVVHPVDATLWQSMVTYGSIWYYVVIEDCKLEL